MGEKEMSGLDIITMCDDDKKRDGGIMYPLYFGVSCAFFALQVLSKPHVEFEFQRWSEIRDNMLQGSAHILGLLVWKVQKEGSKLKNAEREIENLKQMRREAAKANEKVVRIFATQEQSWLSERKRLRQHIGSLMNELKVFEKNKGEEISYLNEKLKEMEDLVECRDKVLKEEEQKRKEVQEKLAKAEREEEELRENGKQKASFMGKLLKQKEESEMMNKNLCVEVAKLRKDLEQKGKVLAAMVRKSKLDASEKQILLKEIKISKARRKQAEQETKKWRAVSDAKYKRHSLRSMLVNLGSTRLSHISKEPEQIFPMYDHYLPKSYEELANTAKGKRLEHWVKAGAEKYAAMIEQRHHSELDALAEEMSDKDEKLEAFHWQLLRMESESRKQQSHVEGLVKDVTHLRHAKMKLERLLLEKEEELTSLKEKFTLQMKSSKKWELGPVVGASLLQSSELEFESPLREMSTFSARQCLKQDWLQRRRHVENQKNCFKCNLLLTSRPQELEVAEDDIWSKVMRKPGQKVQEMEGTLIVEDCEKQVDSPEDDESEEEEENDVSMEEIPTTHLMQKQKLNKTNNSIRKMDLHALGVSYKIKRLKQQLVLIERLTGWQANGEGTEIDDDSENDTMKTYLSLTSLLNKQVGRYQSLQEKTDGLCKRMFENDLCENGGDLNAATTKKKTETLEEFLEETFQIQRYIVASGQNLLEIQSKIVSGFVGVAKKIEKNGGIDMKRFADSIKNLLQEVQRCLEIQTARIIGDLEGTLTCEGR